MSAIFGMGAFAAPSMSSGSGTDRMVPAEHARLAQTCANAGVPTLAVKCMLSICFMLLNSLGDNDPGRLVSLVISEAQMIGVASFM